MRSMPAQVVAYLRGKIPRARAVYSSRGASGIAEGAVDFLRREEVIRYVQRWHEGSRWERLRRKAKNGETLARLDWGRLFVDPADPGISKELLVHRTHEPIATSLLRETIQEGMVVVDIGSNIGYYLTLAASRVGRSGKVVGIEPAPRNVQLLRRNIELNGLTNVSVVEGAAADRDGDGVLYVSNLSNWHSTLASSQAQRGEVSVKMFKIDTLVESLGLPRVDLIRMDIEGAEIEAVPGMLRTLQTWWPKLVIELHPPLVGAEPIRKLQDALAGLGYVPQHIVPRGLDYAQPVPWYYHLDWVKLISGFQTWFTVFYVRDPSHAGGDGRPALQSLLRKFPVRPSRRGGRPS